RSALDVSVFLPTTLPTHASTLFPYTTLFRSIGRTVLRLTDPSGGRIVFDGRDITHLDRAELRPLRREMQMIFQDLDAGLNPKMRSEEHTSELQSRFDLVCRLLLEKKNRNRIR